MTFFQAILEKYPLGKERPPIEELQPLPSAQQVMVSPKSFLFVLVSMIFLNKIFLYYLAL